MSQLNGQWQWVIILHEQDSARKSKTRPSRETHTHTRAPPFQCHTWAMRVSQAVIRPSRMASPKTFVYWRRRSEKRMTPSTTQTSSTSQESGKEAIERLKRIFCRISGNTVTADKSGKITRATRLETSLTSPSDTVFANIIRKPPFDNGRGGRKQLVHSQAGNN